MHTTGFLNKANFILSIELYFAVVFGVLDDDFQKSLSKVLIIDFFERTLW